MVATEEMAMIMVGTTIELLVEYKFSLQCSLGKFQSLSLLNLLTAIHLGVQTVHCFSSIH
jgi:hypothetical protein